MVIRYGRIGLGICVVVCLLSVSMTARAGLLAHWRLDDAVGTQGPDSIVDSLSGHPGTPVIGPSPATPLTLGLPGALAGITDTTGTAADFNNVSIDVPFDPALNPESFTFAAFAKADATAGFQAVVTSRFDIAGGQEGFILYNNSGGQWDFWTGPGTGGWNTLPGGTVTTGEWTHLAISYDAGTNTKRIYVNGVETGSNNGGYKANTGRDLHLGAGADFGDQFRFDGMIDDASLWNVALSPSDIDIISQVGAFAVPDNQVAFWTLDDPPGSATIMDSVAGRNGSIPPPPPPAFALGHPGANGNTGTSVALSNASIDVPYSPALNTESFTLTVWAKASVADGSPYSVVTNREDIGPGTNTRGFVLYNIGGRWEFWTGDGFGGGLDGDFWDIIAGPDVVVDEWTHLAISYDDATDTKSLYVNGVLMGSVVDPNQYTPNLSRDLHIGAGGDFGDQFKFRGQIDDVLLFDMALDETVIRGIMNNSLQPPVIPEPGMGVLGLLVCGGMLGRRHRR